MKEEVYYVKSFEEDFSTKTLKHRKKVTFQTVYNIVKSGHIKPNTKSFGRKRRLSTTLISKNYLKTYRPQGIIFKTKEIPDYVIPFDLTVLVATKDIIVHYYRIKDKLHIYYNRTLIPGFEKFFFNDFSSLIKKYKSPKMAWISLNSFRKNKGFNELPLQKYRLVEYNEAVFHKTIKIIPVALFGYRKETSNIADKVNLPHFVSSKHFFNSLKNEKE